MKVDITWAVVSTLLIAIVTAIISFIKFNRDVKIEQITKERTKWREEIRRISKELVSLDYSIKSANDILRVTQMKSSLLAELEMRLNPYDDFDIDILSYAQKDLSIRENRDIFILSISFLLKQDWEIVKNESLFFKKSRNISRIDTISLVNYQENKGDSKVNIFYFSFLVFGVGIAIYFLFLNFFIIYIPEVFRIKISNAAIITAIYISFLCGISRRYKIKTNLIDGHKPTYCVALAVLLNYFLLYENGDMDRAIASGLMVFATSMLVTMLGPKD
ncbi:hypothetical protein [Haemophilus haemolyticus]|uniref:hypothetical protein n=1 Tax=Haemophilus haemolyticus TaxID=726 RepID=UPI000E59144D|nr:hypothetical protein [Haemophilus haemolyticus]